MKCTYYILLTIALFCLGSAGLNAQKVNVIVAKNLCPPPVIDGIEEELWDDVDPVYLELNLGTEQPSVTAYWKALWDNENIYVLINVEDDDHYPAWESGGNSWEYDKPEIYFDVNDTLVDGLGPAAASSGHYQFAPGFEEDGYGEMHEVAGTTQAPGGQYAYNPSVESYVFEYAVTLSSMSNKEGVTMDCGIINELPENTGFDVTVIDQDEGVTTARQRKIWQSGDGSDAEVWNNMDACGTITIYGPCIYDCFEDTCSWDYCSNRINDIKTAHVAIHPNPVSDFLTINADFDKVVINNILGQEISNISQIKTDKLYVGYLFKGIYFIKVYKGERYIGAAKIMKI